MVWHTLKSWHYVITVASYLKTDCHTEDQPLLPPPPEMSDNPQKLIYLWPVKLFCQFLYFTEDDCNRYITPFSNMKQDHCVMYCTVITSGVFRMCERRGPRGSGDGSPPVGSRGKAPVGGLGDEVPQKLTLFCYWMPKFWCFRRKKSVKQPKIPS